jgi:hypothetical protein
MTNAQLTEALEFEIGECGGGGGPDTPDYHYRSSGLRIWGAWNSRSESEEPVWKGQATLAMARQVYGIKTPQEFREPTLFDFAQDRQQKCS